MSTKIIGNQSKITGSVQPGYIQANHNSLTNRDLANQHPISAITNLTDELAGKLLISEYNINRTSDKVNFAKIITTPPEPIAANTGILWFCQPAGSTTYTSYVIVYSNGEYIRKQVSQDIDLTDYYKKSETYNRSEIDSKDATIYSALQDNVQTLSTAINTEKAERESGNILGEVFEGQPYNLPYYFSTDVQADKIKVSADVISLDGNKTKQTYSLNVEGATSNKAGLMTAADKVNLDTTIPAAIQQEKNRATGEENSLRGLINQEITNRTNADNTLSTRITTIEGDYLKAADKQSLNNAIVTETNRAQSAENQLTILLGQEAATRNTADTGLSNRITAIENKIPEQASSSNQLADKAFVNSSISTETAYFRGTYNIITDLGLTKAATETEISNALKTKVTTVTNNDYAYVAYPNDTVTTMFDRYDRYKYNVSDSGWWYEYTLNNSSFTAAQWNAINSGITSLLVNQINTNKDNITTINASAPMNSGITTDKVTNYDEHIANNDIHVTATQKEQWNEKQDKLTAASTIEINNNTIGVNPDLELTTIKTTGKASLNGSIEVRKLANNKNGIIGEGCLVLNRGSAITENSIGDKAVILGDGCVATDEASIAAGKGARAGGSAAMAINKDTKAIGKYSFAQGIDTFVSGVNSQAFGNLTAAIGGNQTVIGKLNIPNQSDNLFIVGNGVDEGKKTGRYQASELIGYYVINKDQSGYAQRYVEITADNCQSVWANTSITTVYKLSNAFTIGKDGSVSAANLKENGTSLSNKYQEKLIAGNNIIIAEDGKTISAVGGGSNFRGNWDAYSAVPTDSSLYRADSTGSKIPVKNDYILIKNASDYEYTETTTTTINYNITRSAHSTVFTLTYPDSTTSSITQVNDGVTSMNLGKNNEFVVKSIGNAEWTIKCIYDVVYNNVSYKAGAIILTSMYYDNLNANMSATVTTTVTKQCDGTWQFKYDGVWATDGKNGWKHDYQAIWNSKQEKVQHIELTGTSGTLTDEQFNIISNDQLAYITLGGNRYNFHSAIVGRSGLIITFSSISGTLSNYIDINLSKAWQYYSKTLQEQLTQGANITISNNVIGVSGLATVATSGSYNDLSDKPTLPAVPTKTSELTNDSNFATIIEAYDVYVRPNDSLYTKESLYSHITPSNLNPIFVRGDGAEQTFEFTADYHYLFSADQISVENATKVNVVILKDTTLNRWVCKVIVKNATNDVFIRIAGIAGE